MSLCSPTRPGRSDRLLLLGELATRAFAELLIDCEEDRTLGAVLVGRTSDVGFRFLLELSDLDRHSECTGDIARS
jgi:hypothetical protein